MAIHGSDTNVRNRDNSRRPFCALPMELIMDDRANAELNSELQQKMLSAMKQIYQENTSDTGGIVLLDGEWEALCYLCGIRPDYFEKGK